MFAVRRLAQYALVLFAAVVFNFALPRVAPGNPVDFLLPPEQAISLTHQQRTQLLAEFGLDKPIPVQFERYLVALAHGDLLYSVRYGQPVRDLLAERLPWTLLLVGTTTLLSVLLGSLFGFRSAWRRGTAGDVRTLGTFMLIDSMPAFFVGMLLILAFSVKLAIFPIFGAIPVVPQHGFAAAVEVGKRLILPLVALTLSSVGSIYLVARSALVTELQDDYVLMAEAKGLQPGRVRRHAERNALLPISTESMLAVGHLVGGAVVVETVFSYPGIGRLIYDSVLARDYPVLQGAFLLLAVTVVAANALSDLLYPFLDPRVRRPAASGS